MFKVFFKSLSCYLYTFYLFSRYSFFLCSIPVNVTILTICMCKRVRLFVASKMSVPTLPVCNCHTAVNPSFHLLKVPCFKMLQNLTINPVDISSFYEVTELDVLFTSFVESWFCERCIFLFF